jgi:hypothetical protein
MMAKELLEQFDLDSCEVSEDGENGGRVTLLEMVAPVLAKQPKDSNPASDRRFGQACFMGKECEGPYGWRDQGTLFIPGSYPAGSALNGCFNRFAERLHRTKKYQPVIPVYLGADNDLKHNSDTVESILEQLASLSRSGKDTRLIVEVESVNDFLNVFGDMWNRERYSDLDKYLVSRNPDDVIVSECFAIKIFGKDRIIWVATDPQDENEYVFSTPYNDERFTKDVVI